MIPAKLRLHLDAVGTSIRATPADLTPGLGAIAIASEPGGSRRRIALVNRIDREMQIARIVLMSNAVDMATDLDLIVTPDDCGYPVPLMAEAELYGPVFVEQLKDCLGQLPAALLHAASASLTTDGESLNGHRVGVPLRPDDRVRRDFKYEELADLELLVSACRSFIEGAPCPEAILDPALLLPPPEGTDVGVARDQYLALIDAIDELTSRNGSAVELLELLTDAELYDELPRWATEFGCDLRPFTLDRRAVRRDDGQRAKPRPELLADSSLSPVERRMLALVDVYADQGFLAVDVLTNNTESRVIVRQGPTGQYCRARPRELEPA